jgi:succinate dehydrogenase / fumarate reductase flavoprotein subunit
MSEGTLHLFRARCRARDRRLRPRLFLLPPAHTCTGEAAAWCCVPASSRCRTWNSWVPSDRHLRRGCLITGAVRRGRLSDQLEGRALHGRCAGAKDLASRDVVSRAMTIESAKAAVWRAPTTCLNLITLGRSHSRTPPGIAESSRIFAGVDVCQAADPGAAACTTTWGHPSLSGGRAGSATIPMPSCLVDAIVWRVFPCMARITG